MTNTMMTNGGVWVPTWAQAVSDYRGEDDEPGFDNVTVRMTVPAAYGGTRVKFELSNRFTDAPVRIGKAAVGVGGVFVEAAFDGHPSHDIPVGESVWSDPVDLRVNHGDNIVIDVYLPEATPYATAAGFRFDRSIPGEFVAAQIFPFEDSTPVEINTEREFPAINTGPHTGTGTEEGADRGTDAGGAKQSDKQDTGRTGRDSQGTSEVTEGLGEVAEGTNTTKGDTGWSLPAGGPLLRTVEVTGAEPKAVVVALGGSSTAMGWPQYTAAVLPPEAGITVVNRGISGNRIRLDAPASTPSWGLSGLNRFEADVLGTTGVTHVVISYNSNDWGLPGRVTSIDEMPTTQQLIAGYEELIRRAEAAGLGLVLATVTPLSPEALAESDKAGEPDREGMRLALNEWIRHSGYPLADFDAAIRSTNNPGHLEPRYAAPDNTHPNVNGEKHLAEVAVATFKELGLL